MTRRSFFSLIAAGVAAGVDPERSLWVPGRKLISIPRPQELNLDEFSAIFLKPAMEQVALAMEQFIRSGTGHLLIEMDKDIPRARHFVPGFPR